MSKRPQTDEQLIEAIREELSLFRAYVLTDDGWAEMGSEHGPIRSANRERLESLARYHSQRTGLRYVVLDLGADPKIVFAEGKIEASA